MDLDRFNLVKTSQNRFSGCSSYGLSHINPKYGHFLYCSIHFPREAMLKSKRLENSFARIYLHRYNPFAPGKMGEAFDREIKQGSTSLVYEGLIENEKDLDFLLKKLCITQ